MNTTYYKLKLQTGLPSNSLVLQYGVKRHTAKLTCNWDNQLIGCKRFLQCVWPEIVHRYLGTCFENTKGNRPLAPKHIHICYKRKKKDNWEGFEPAPCSKQAVKRKERWDLNSIKTLSSIQKFIFRSFVVRLIVCSFLHSFG